MQAKEKILSLIVCDGNEACWFEAQLCATLLSEKESGLFDEKPRRGAVARSQKSKISMLEN
jgi:hypothetical protein